MQPVKTNSEKIGNTAWKNYRHHLQKIYDEMKPS